MTKPAPRKLNARAILRGPAVSVASQGTGVVQLGLVLTRAGTNRDTDAYFYLFSIGLVPIMCVIVGMMYPSLLNERRISRSGLVAIRRWTSLLCALFVVGGALWLAYRGRLPSELFGLAAFSTALAVVQARVWFRAVAAEASGNPLWISGVALLPNVLAVASLVYPWHAPATAMTVMVAALLVGNLSLLAVMAHRQLGQSVIDAAPPTSVSRSGHFWFLGLSAVGYLGQIFLQSLAVLLPASSITILNLGAKVVLSVSSTFVNASMPVLIHQDTDSPSAARRFLRIVVLVVGLGGIVLVAGVWIGWPSLLRPAIAVALWLFASSAAAVALRMSYRFLPPKSTVRTISVVILVSLLAGLSARGTGFDISVALCAYAMLDAASALLLLLPLCDRWMSVLLGGVVAGLAGTWAVSYL